MPPKKESKWKYLGLLPIIVILASLIGGWYTVRADASEAKAKANENEEAIHQLEVNEAAESKVIESINKSLEEIKQQTKEIPNIKKDIGVLEERSRKGNN